MSTDSEVVTGYYRYTDIWFEWYVAPPRPNSNANPFPYHIQRHKVIPNSEDGAALKGLLGQLAQYLSFCNQ